MKVKNVWVFKCDFCDKELELTDGWSDNANTSSLKTAALAKKYYREYNGWYLAWKFDIDGSVFACEDHKEAYISYEKDLQKWELSEREIRKTSFFDFVAQFKKLYKPHKEKPKISDYIEKQ